MQDNLTLWNAVRRPPQSALKSIPAGRMKGMTNICPMWRIEVLTEQLGPCGVGWYFEIKDRWTEAGPAGEMMCFTEIALYIVKGEGWSAPIVGVGGAALIAKESSGLRADDEAPKKALTDALSVAMKHLGVAADIYLGMYDGSKYTMNSASAAKPALSVVPASLEGIKATLASAVASGGNNALKAEWSILDEGTKAHLREYLATIRAAA